MSNHRLGLIIHQRLPVLAGVYPYSSSRSVTCAVSSPSEALLKKWKIGGRAPRRLVLGLGVSVLTQFMSMADTVGRNSFIAYARQKSNVEEVIY